MAGETLKTTEAQRRASLKWEKANNQKITVKLRIGRDPSKEEITAAAKAAGMSVNAWILEAIIDKLQILWTERPGSGEPQL